MVGASGQEKRPRRSAGAQPVYPRGQQFSVQKLFRPTNAIMLEFIGVDAVGCIDGCNGASKAGVL
jgi:hypothetical protein